VKQKIVATRLLAGRSRAIENGAGRFVWDTGSHSTIVCGPVENSQHFGKRFFEFPYPLPLVVFIVGGACLDGADLLFPIWE
jgi:hypothetical protein